MPNIASVLKAEISRVARKELRSATEGLKKVAAAQRFEIASLKKRIQELEKQLKAQVRATSRGGVLKASSSASTESEEPAGGLRFRPAGMAANRKRLGLSAADFGLLVGAAGQSVYSWEQGKSKPRGRNLVAIAALRGIGKREVAQRLALLKADCDARPRLGPRSRSGAPGGGARAKEEHARGARSRITGRN